MEAGEWERGLYTENGELKWVKDYFLRLRLAHDSSSSMDGGDAASAPRPARARTTRSTAAKARISTVVKIEITSVIWLLRISYQVK